MTLACDGHYYSLHKFVLSVCSEYFEEMFERTDCKHPVIVLNGVKCDVLESLLNYMYIGEVSVLQENLSALIRAAEYLKIRGLALPDEEPTQQQRQLLPPAPATSSTSGPASKSHQQQHVLENDIVETISNDSQCVVSVCTDAGIENDRLDDAGGVNGGVNGGCDGGGGKGGCGDGRGGGVKTMALGNEDNSPQLKKRRLSSDLPTAYSSLKRPQSQDWAAAPDVGLESTEDNAVATTRADTEHEETFPASKNLNILDTKHEVRDFRLKFSSFIL